MGSVERCFELRWRNVRAVAVQPLLVEPVHPRQGGELKIIDAAEGAVVADDSVLAKG